MASKYKMFAVAQRAVVGVPYRFCFEPLDRANVTTDFAYTVTITPSIFIVQDAIGFTFTPSAGDIGAHTLQIDLAVSGVPTDSVSVPLTVYADTKPVVRACMIGDSITERLSVVDWFTDLDTLGGGNITFVGGRGTAPHEHEGVGGWTAWYQATNPASHFVVSGSLNIASFIATYCGGVAPTLWHIMLGTNDVRSYGDANPSASQELMRPNLIALVNAIKAATPAAKIVVAYCTPSVTATAPLRFQFREGLRRVARIYGGDPSVVFATPFFAVIPRLTVAYGDSVHPNAAGCVDMARSIYAAIVAAMA